VGFVVQEEALPVAAGLGLMIASIYALNKVPISIKTASDVEKKLQHPC
jgi:hypothetical protein